MAVEALKRTEKAVSISQVNKALDARLQSLLNPYGQIDQKSLPRDVTLSNDRKYRLIKQVGKGGMGTVFRGKIIDDPNGGSVAIKISHTDASQERAQREADILKRLSSVNHDNIVKFLDSALDGSCLVIVMELINGKPLDDWLDFRYSDGNPGVSFLDTAPIVKQLAEGMAVVHSHKIAHRDIKPGNLIFDEVTTKLVIVDFGLSKQHYANSTMTSANDQLGTLLYMSPEQLDGDISAVSFPSDVWSIGIVWHEMLTNYTPFEPSDRGGERRSSNSRSKRRTFSKREENNMLNEVLKEGPRALPMLTGSTNEESRAPTEGVEIIAKCLNAEKKKRYQDAQELVNDLSDMFKKLEKVREAEVPLSPSKKGGRKPFKEWTFEEVSELVREIGFSEAADAIKDNRINGEVFSEMLDTNDEDLMTKIEDDGLVFKKMQVKVVKAEVKKRE